MSVTRPEPPSSGPVVQASIALAPMSSRSERQSPTAEQALGPQLPPATASNALTTQPQSVVPPTVKVSRKRKTSHQKKRAAEEKSMRKQLTAQRALEFRTDRQSAKRLKRAATPAVRQPVHTSDDSESELSSDSDGSSSSDEDSSRGPSRTPSPGTRSHRNYRTTHNRRRAPPRPASPMESEYSNEDVDPEAVSLTSSNQYSDADDQSPYDPEYNNRSYASDTHPADWAPQRRTPRHQENTSPTASTSLLLRTLYYKAFMASWRIPVLRTGGVRAS